MARVWGIIGYGFAVTGLLACGEPAATGASGDQAAIRHPVRELLASEKADAPVVLVDPALPEESGTEPSILPASFPEESAVGSIGDTTLNTLGGLVDAAIGGAADGHVLLLDRSLGRVSVFDRVGQPVKAVGGFGDGPGEFVDPLAISATDSTFVVLDGVRRIHEFSLGRDGWEFQDRRPLPFRAVDACNRGTYVVALGPVVLGEPDDNRVGRFETVHQLDTGGAITASFSAPYASKSFLAFESLTSGRLVCDAAGNVWAAYSALGEVHGLRLDGTTKWIARILDFSYPEIVEHPGVSIGPDPQSSDRFDVIENISLVSPTILAVQVSSREMADILARRDRKRLRTYLLDAQTGEGIEALEADYRVIGGGAGVAVLYREDPYPQFALVEIGGRR